MFLFFNFITIITIEIYIFLLYIFFKIHKIENVEKFNCLCNLYYRKYLQDCWVHLLYAFSHSSISVLHTVPTRCALRDISEQVCFHVK